MITLICYSLRGLCTLVRSHFYQVSLSPSALSQITPGLSQSIKVEIVLKEGATNGTGYELQCLSQWRFSLPFSCCFKLIFLSSFVGIPSPCSFFFSSFLVFALCRDSCPARIPLIGRVVATDQTLSSRLSYKVLMRCGDMYMWKRERDVVLGEKGRFEREKERGRFEI